MPQDDDGSNQLLIGQSDSSVIELRRALIISPTRVPDTLQCPTLTGYFI
jgi:hypothetical protein